MDKGDSIYHPSFKQRVTKAKEIYAGKRTNNLAESLNEIVYSWLDAPKAFSDDMLKEAQKKYPIANCIGQTMIKVKNTYLLDASNSDPSVIAEKLSDGICNQVLLQYGGNLNKVGIKSQIERNLQLADPSYRAAELQKAVVS